MSKNNSRTKNSINNIILTVIYQIISTIGSFVLRTIFIRTLAVEILGLNGLFSNILSVLSLAELGVGSAINYSMYKPLKENDEKKLAGLITYYKRIYSVIGLVILAIGLIILPFLPLIINFENEVEHVALYYVFYLLNSVSSYFIVYKTTIVKAAQKGYKLKLIDISFVLLRTVLQAIALIVYKNYIMYLIIQISLSILQNYVSSLKAVKMFPFIRNKEEISKKEKKDIWDNIKSLFLYKIGGVALNNTDNIIISIIVSTITVGLYSNYSMIVMSLSTFTSLIFTAITSSIGNYNVDSDAKHKKLIFDVLEMMSFWVYGFCSICLLILFKDFIFLWAGESFLLSNATTIIIVLNYYITGVLYPIYCFRTTTNLFRSTKYVMFVATIINIILSIILGKLFGLAGILIATAISRIITNVWYEPYILFRDYFKSNVLKYYFKKIVEIVLLIGVYFVTLFVVKNIVISNKIIEFIIKGIVCTIVSNLAFLLLFSRREEFKFVIKRVFKVKS